MNEVEESLSVLLSWMNTFDLPQRVTSTYDLTDGTILLTVLNFLASEYFLDPKTDAYLTTQDKLERFDDIKIGINKFCTHGLSNRLNLTEGLISRELVGGGSSKDWVTLLELVLLTSIKSTRKNLCIQRMMHQLNQSEQERLMKLISDSLVKFGLTNPSESSVDVQKPNNRTHLSEAGEYRSISDSGYNSEKITTRRESKSGRKHEELQSQLAELNSELVAATSKCELLETRRADWQREVKALEEEASTLKEKHLSELSEKEQVIQKMTSQIKELESLLKKKAADIKKLEGKIAFSQEEARDWEKHAQELKKTNEELMILKTQENSAASKLAKMEEDLLVASSYRRKVKILEAKESQNKLKLDSYKSQVDNLKNYKEMYEKQLTRSAELEQELSELPALRRQLEDCKQTMVKYQVEEISMKEGESKLHEIEKKLETSEAEKDLMKQKLDEAHKDLQELEDIVKGVQQAEAVAMASMQSMPEPMELTRYKRKIASLEAELKETVSQSKHKEILSMLDTEKRLVKQLSEKLTLRGQDFQIRAAEEMKYRIRIEELEKRNSKMNEELSSFQKEKRSTSAQLTHSQKENAAAIKALEEEHQNEIKKVKEQLIEERVIHSREQRLMVSAVKSFGNGLLGSV